VDTFGIVLAFFGQLAPIVAALIHVGSELAFILNSARLFRHQPANVRSRNKALPMKVAVFSTKY
jgi:cation transport ATPase